MIPTITLSIIAGPQKGKEFSFNDHDTFLFGRMPDCHVCISGDDYLSRRHFILEVNPPFTRLQDLGSLNGTYVNKKKFGGRDPGETPEEAKKKYHFPWIDLNDQDEITTGDTIFKLTIQGLPENKLTVICQKCGEDVSNEAGNSSGSDYICESCRRKAEETPSDFLQNFLKKFLDEAQKAQLTPDGKVLDNQEDKNKEKNKKNEKTGKQGDLPIKLPGYDYVRTIKAGGFGVVYQVREIETSKDLALKLMLPRIATDEESKKGS